MSDETELDRQKMERLNREQMLGLRVIGITLTIIGLLGLYVMKVGG